jgi:large subunit ribosomal protein L24
MLKIKRDDEVIVIAGKDKGRRGKVRKLVGDDRVLVAGVNMIKKHTKPNPQAGIQGGIVEREAAMQMSNIAIFNPETSKPDRVGFRVDDGKKVRIYKSTGAVVDS